MTNILLSIGVGLAAGILSGMFGIGGGIIIVPALVLALGFSQHKAQGTSLVALLLPFEILGVMEYWKQKEVDVKAGLFLAAGLFVGAFIGSKISLGIEPTTMRKTFAVFLVVVGVYQFFKK